MNYFPVSVVWQISCPFQYKIDCRVTIELLDTETEDTEKSVADAKTWSNYVERLANPIATATTTGATGQNNGSNSSSTGAINSANNINNNNNNSSGSNSADTVEIKTEKLDDDVVSAKHFNQYRSYYEP